jgi:hypothetical protein
VSNPSQEDIRKVMQELGRRGGQVTSAAKKASGRLNVAKALKARLAKSKKKIS